MKKENLIKKRDKLQKKEDKFLYKGTKAVDEGREKRADRFLGKAAKAEDRKIKVESKIGKSAMREALEESAISSLIKGRTLGGPKKMGGPERMMPGPKIAKGVKPSY